MIVRFFVDHLGDTNDLKKIQFMYMVVLNKSTANLGQYDIKKLYIAYDATSVFQILVVKG